MGSGKWGVEVFGYVCIGIRSDKWWRGWGIWICLYGYQVGEMVVGVWRYLDMFVWVSGRIKTEDSGIVGEFY